MVRRDKAPPPGAIRTMSCQVIKQRKSRATSRCSHLAVTPSSPLWPPHPAKITTCRGRHRVRSVAPTWRTWNTAPTANWHRWEHDGERVSMWEVIKSREGWLAADEHPGNGTRLQTRSPRAADGAGRSGQAREVQASSEVTAHAGLSASGEALTIERGSLEARGEVALKGK